MYIDTSGNLVASGNVTAYSDRRLKENIVPFDRELAINMVKHIQPVSYVRKETGHIGIGFIAQDVEPYAPCLVYHGEDGYLSLAYPNMIAVLWEVVKALQEKIA